ncbi:MAG: hypothetical protein JWQ35_918 [Bacteriovoracaceae bacterium]|nr:hypothetical protein [Bacteriovoracaceae bacterium]
MLNLKNRFVLASILIVIAALSRLIPHPYNFSPIDGLALFAGSTLWPKRFFAFLVPLLALFLGDLALGFHSTMPFVYGSVAIMVLLGVKLGSKPGVSSLFQMSLLSSVIFFLVTNFGFWITTPAYPRNAIGLMECYTAALPFFHWTVLGDFVFTFGLFTAFSKIESFALSRDAA